MGDFFDEFYVGAHIHQGGQFGRGAVADIGNGALRAFAQIGRGHSQANTTGGASQQRVFTV